MQQLYFLCLLLVSVPHTRLLVFSAFRSLTKLLQSQRCSTPSQFARPPRASESSRGRECAAARSFSLPFVAFPRRAHRCFSFSKNAVAITGRWWSGRVGSTFTRSRPRAGRAAPGGCRYSIHGTARALSLCLSLVFYWPRSRNWLTRSSDGSVQCYDLAVGWRAGQRRLRVADDPMAELGSWLQVRSFALDYSRL